MLALQVLAIFKFSTLRLSGTILSLPPTKGPTANTLSALNFKIRYNQVHPEAGVQL